MSQIEANINVLVTVVGDWNGGVPVRNVLPGQALVNARTLMPLPPESLIKIYRSKRNLGSSRPVIVAVGDTTHDGIPFGEFYVFQTFSDVPFLYSRSVCGFVDEWSPIDFGRYPEIFSASALLDSSFCSARDRLEHEASMHDRELFCQAPPLDFEEVDEFPLIQFRVFQVFTSECTKMFGFSRSNAIRELKEKVQQYPVIKLVLEPKV